ncbi:MAG: AIPR family protein [Magnetococcales bacterium]|nr:AIPR family protein [Magnetococcales bacterium]
MTEDEYRSDVLASAASRAETRACGLREGFVEEVLDRLRDAGELPDFELCPELVAGPGNRKLEIDAFAFDDADESLHLFVALHDGGTEMPPAIARTEAKDQGFNRLVNVFECSRDGWLGRNVEESRPLWALARRLERAERFSALRLHVVSDRCVSDKLRELPPDTTKEGLPVTFQIWDMTRLKRIHEAGSARDDLIVEFSHAPGGGLPVLPGPLGGSGYSGYLAVIPAEVLADIYIRHGSRLLEGNVRTYLGRRGNVNKGIATTIAKEPERFFAYNNGIACTASGVEVVTADNGALMILSATDLQIVNGAQTTASLAAARRDKDKKDLSGVFVPMKLSVVQTYLALQMIPRISRFANSQNGVRASDFFANHEFHRKIEETSRRILAPAVGSSQVQTHWYYERARGQHLNDQAGMTDARKNQFLRMNPKHQVITKTDLAKVENCFDGLPDIACKGAEKSFTSFAERITKDWDERKPLYGDDWFRAAVVRVILFRATERLVSEAPWYEGGYRAQIVAYAVARIATLAREQSAGGRLDYQRVWHIQAPSGVLEDQILMIAERMAQVLRNPPLAGQNISEWAKQQACRKAALETEVSVIEGFGDFLLPPDEAKATARGAWVEGKIDDGIRAVSEVMSRSSTSWIALRDYAREMRLLGPEDEKALFPVITTPPKVPTDRQAERLMALLARCQESGLSC